MLQCTLQATRGFPNFNMSFYAISALINLFASLILGLIVLLRRNKEKVHYIFALFAGSVSVWSLGYYFWQVATSADTALFWSRVLMAGAIFIPITYLHFVFALLEMNSKYKKYLV